MTSDMHVLKDALSRICVLKGERPMLPGYSVFWKTVEARESHEAKVNELVEEWKRGQ